MLDERDTKKLLSLLQIIKYLQDSNSPVCVNDLARKLNVSKRTVLRYIDDLVYIGININTLHGKIELDHKNPIIKLDFLNTNPNFLLSILLSPMISEVMSYLPKEVKRKLNRILKVFRSKEKTSSEVMKMLPKLIRSTINRNKLQITYLSLSQPNNPSQRVIHPYFLFRKEDNYYLIAFCETKNEIRTFRLDRIKELKILKDKFKIIPNFDPKQYIDSPFIIFSSGNNELVKAEISNKLRAFLESSPIHSSQKIYEENGKNIVEFVIPSIEEFVRWALAWEEEIKIIYPQKAVELMKEKIKRISGMYS